MSTLVDTTGIAISTQMSRLYYADLCHLLQLRTVRMHTTKVTPCVHVPILNCSPADCIETPIGGERTISVDL
jgi:hypothetical protein